MRHFATILPRPAADGSQLKQGCPLLFFCCHAPPKERAEVKDPETSREASLLEAIVQSSDDAIISKDLSGTITTWNRAAERIFGYAAGEVIGGPISIIIPPERGAEEIDILQRISRGERIEHFET